MNIAIIGSGNVGGALAKSSVRGDAEREGPINAEAKAKDAGARAGKSAAEAVKDAEVVILAVPDAAVDAIIGELADALAGKVLVDVTNRMRPNAIADSVDGSSAAEQIQQKAPKRRSRRRSTTRSRHDKPIRASTAHRRMVSWKPTTATRKRRASSS